MVVHGQCSRCGFRHALRVLTMCAALSLPGFLTPKLVAQRFGVEFQVNTYTTAFQFLPSVAASAGGAFVIVWSSEQDSSLEDLIGRRFSSTGAPLAGEFQVNTSTAGLVQFPSVAAAPNGDFLVVWGSTQSGSPDVFARLYSSAGAALTGEVPVNVFAPGTQNLPRVAALGPGDFVTVWASSDQDGSGNGVFARRFTSAGAPVASEFQVNSYTTGAQGNPAVAAGASGDFVVVWHSINGQDGQDAGVFAQRFSSAGTALGTEFQVNAYTVLVQQFPAVAAAASGDFIVAWAGNGEYANTTGIFARRFSSAGVALASEFLVNTHSLDAQQYPMVAAGTDGDFVIVWESANQDSSGFGVFGRSFSSAGVALASEFQVNTYVDGAQRYPQVGAAANGNFVVAWQSYAQDGDEDGIFAQRFALLKAIDIDGDGLVLPLTDGILLLRFTFGFSGDVLTDGAVNTDACMRCDAATIEPYLQTLVN